MTVGPFIGSLAPELNPFDGNYLTEILEATARAWARMKHPEQKEKEDRITRRLTGRLLNDPEFAEIPYDVSTQYWLLDINGKALGRLDLRFRHLRSQRDYFTFEAKRLHVTYPGGKRSKEYSTYVGTEGMMAFIEEHYSSNVPAGGMIGYVMDADSDQAWSGLLGQIASERKSLKLIARGDLSESPFSKAVLSNAIDGSRLGETEHDLQPRHLRLFHLLLPVRREALPQENPGELSRPK